MEILLSIATGQVSFRDQVKGGHKGILNLTVN